MTTKNMTNQKPFDASDSTPTTVYVVSSKRRFVVRAVFRQNQVTSLSELLLRFMCKDGEPPIEKHDTDRKA